MKNPPLLLPTLGLLLGASLACGPRDVHFPDTGVDDTGVGDTDTGLGDDSGRGDTGLDDTGFDDTGLGDVDADGDGVRAADDCDDADADVHPGAYDECGDALDADCDGAALRCPLLGDVPATSGIQLRGGAMDELAGLAVAGVGDVDGDGRDDVLFGSEWIATAGEDAGGAYLAVGPFDRDRDRADMDAWIDGEAPGDHAGSKLAGGGDLDGDGLSDLLIAATFADSNGIGSGIVYLVSGTTRGAFGLGAARARLMGEGEQAYTGLGLQSAGDVDGDGVGDVVIGAPGLGESTTGREAPGGVYVVSGNVTGDVDLATGALARVIGEESADWAGGDAVAGVGDVDGDGLDDLLVGALCARDFLGAAYLLHGPIPQTSLADADAIIVNDPSSEYLGYSVSSAGDQDGDGLPDLMVTAPWGGSASVVGVLPGTIAGETPIGDAFASFTDVGINGEVALAGDVDGDGVSDLLVGNRYDDSVGTDSGVVGLAYGPVSGTTSLLSMDAVIRPETEDGLGIDVSAAGDVDGDGFDDLLLGAWKNPDAAPQAGAAFILFGAPR